MRPREDWDALLTRLQADLSARARGLKDATSDDSWAMLRLEVQRIARLLAAPEDREDVVQAVLLKLQSPVVLSRLQAARSPAGYLVVMVKHQAIDAIRRGAPFPVVPGVPVEIFAPGASLDAPLIAEREGRLARAVQALPDADRLLLRLRFWQGLSIREIADRLGMPYSTVAVRLFRIVRKLRAKLGIAPGAERG
jgi:RNA polymerase sigma factor (sigma-70 family)